MTRSLSRKLLVVEAVVLAVPLTALLALSLSTVSISSNDLSWSGVVVDSITVLAAFAVAAGWWLIIAGIRGGAEGLRNTNRAWWLAACMGVALVIAGFVSMFLPASPEYSPEAFFREHLERCILGTPLVIILAHLWAEAWLRKSANNVLQSTRGDARA